MLDTIEELVKRPTRHNDVRCTVTSSGLRFCVETVKVKGQQGTSIEHISWRQLEADGGRELLEAVYERAIARADRWTDEQRRG